MLYYHCDAFGCTVCTLANNQSRAVLDVYSFLFSPKCLVVEKLVAEQPRNLLLRVKLLPPFLWIVFFKSQWTNTTTKCALLSFEAVFPKSPHSSRFGLLTKLPVAPSFLEAHQPSILSSSLSFPK